MKIAVSACLLGTDCKYNGGNNYSEKVAAFLEGHEIIPVCPEVMGGMPTPRIPCERVQEKILNQNGEDMTSQFQDGAQKALAVVLESQADLVILQPRSPSCGIDTVYDGSFSGHLTKGNGVFVELLKQHHIPYLNAQTI